MSTFNGRPWGEAVGILRDARPKKKTDNGKGKPYTDITQFFIFMDKVFDGLYSYQMSEPYFMRLENGQEAVNVKVTLTIFDDDGNRRAFFAGAGTCPFYMNKEGKCTNIQQAYSNAALSAFKDACKGLGIFGYRRDEFTEAKNESAGSVSSSEPPKDRQMVVFHTEGKMNEVKRDKDDRPVWKIGGNVDKRPAELIFYPSHYSKNSEKFNELHGKCEEGMKLALRVEVKPCDQRNGKEQYVFFGYAS